MPSSADSRVSPDSPYILYFHLLYLLQFPPTACGIKYLNGSAEYFVASPKPSMSWSIRIFYLYESDFSLQSHPQFTPAVKSCPNDDLKRGALPTLITLHKRTASDGSRRAEVEWSNFYLLTNFGGQKKSQTKKAKGFQRRRMGSYGGEEKGVLLK